MHNMIKMPPLICISYNMVDALPTTWALLLLPKAAPHQLQSHLHKVFNWINRQHCINCLHTHTKKRMTITYPPPELLDFFTFGEEIFCTWRVTMMQIWAASRRRHSQRKSFALHPPLNVLLPSRGDAAYANNITLPRPPSSPSETGGRWWVVEIVKMIPLSRSSVASVLQQQISMSRSAASWSRFVALR